MNFEKMKAIAPGLGKLEKLAEQAGRRGSPPWLLWVFDHHGCIARYAARVARRTEGDRDELHQVIRAALFASWKCGVVGAGQLRLVGRGDWDSESHSTPNRCLESIFWVRVSL